MAPRKAKKSIMPHGTAVIYARYSSHSQRDVSIDDQVKACQKFADANGLTVIDVYADRAVTGTTDRRPSFQRMMKEAATHRFLYVIAWKSNRMGRNMLEAMQNDMKLRDLGVKTLYTEEDFEDNAAGRFALRNMMNVNQFYSENMAEDVMRGMLGNAEACKVNGLLPFGYKKDADGRFAIDEPRAEIVREIYTRVSNQEPIVSIANDLNARGIKTALGKEWNKNSFHVLLTSEKYLGVYIWGEVRIEGGIPRIVSDELYHRVQEVLKMKKGTKSRQTENGEYLLTGKLFCGLCGSAMIGISGTSHTGEKHFYYSCNQQRIEKTCTKKYARRDWLEFSVASSVCEYILQEDVIDWITKGYTAFLKQCREESMLSVFEAELADVNKGIKNIMTAIEAGIFTSTTKDRLLELEAEKKSLETSIALEKATQEDISPDQIRYLLQSFAQGDLHSKKYQALVISSFVDKVFVYDNEFRIFCPYFGKKGSITISFDEINAIDANDIALGSYKLSCGVPLLPYTNPVEIILLKQGFVLVVPY